MNLGFHEWLLWHVHFVGKVGNHERNCGELCVGESTFAIQSIPKRWGFEDILEFYGESLLKCYVPIFFCPTTMGKND